MKTSLAFFSLLFFAFAVVSARLPAAAAAPAIDQRLSVTKMPPDTIVRLNNETQSFLFKALPPREKLRQAAQKYSNSKNGRSLASNMPNDLVTSLNQLEISGFVDDPVYTEHAIAIMNSGRIFPETSPDDLYHPDCVAVGESPYSFCCSGTLIAPQLVLTAGHCVQGGCAAYICIGTQVTAADRRVVKVREVRRHERYTANPITHDIALLILETAVTDMPPRRIATLAEVTTATEGWIVGFGATNAEGTVGYGRRRVAGPMIVADPTNAHFGATPRDEIVLGRFPYQIGPDTCKGDSGGPVYILTKDGEFIAGVTSRSVAQASQVCGLGGIYTRPDLYVDWINAAADEFHVTRPASR